ncbi:MAG TPA: glycosyltransferase, partial [Dehalococcoidia bacterium]|nr:glycosyltransferase [Dehalococcoidia bacterium]
MFLKFDSTPKKVLLARPSCHDVLDESTEKHTHLSLTIITPVWNTVGTIEHCLRSIAEQTQPCQHILVDGGSTDGTLAIIEQHRTVNMTVISEFDQGMYDAINKGLKLATGDVIGILNSDDFYAKT